MQQANARGTVQAAKEIGYATVNWSDGPNTITVYPYDNSISQNLDTPIPYDCSYNSTFWAAYTLPQKSHRPAHLDAGHDATPRRAAHRARDWL